MAAPSRGRRRSPGGGRPRDLLLKTVVPTEQSDPMTNFWLEPWDERGPILERRANTPEMQAHLGGVESEESIAARRKRILGGVRDGTTGFFLVMVADDPDPIGSVGFWAKEWLGETVCEMGWKVLPGFQGRGIAVGATVAAIGLAAAGGRYRFAHAYPK